ncbi:hypothetical protein LEP1GSC088_3362 [Leptospira interrogans str. L1207]|nr:hypothetical protein LEP1GSC088_3362 [Leptospira interrogans str. L1207]
MSLVKNARTLLCKSELESLQKTIRYDFYSTFEMDSKKF